MSYSPLFDARKMPFDANVKLRTASFSKHDLPGPGRIHLNLSRDGVLTPATKPASDYRDEGLKTSDLRLLSSASPILTSPRSLYRMHPPSSPDRSSLWSRKSMSMSASTFGKCRLTLMLSSAQHRYSVIMMYSGPAETLEPQAVACLKVARYQIMRKIESSYYELQRGRDNPLSLPNWVDPTRPLLISTDKFPTPLHSYKALFTANLLKLLSDCGFDPCSAMMRYDGILLLIYFPHRPSQALNALVLPDTLDMENEFIGMADGAAQGDSKPGGGEFLAADFGRLLIRARGEDVKPSESG
ncbi:hypothetical protein FB451DRAFT_1193643 [Mycena latifolia]|nr:hypothetical protein FB451DRAFT_1193643 [Mycena latifolia]